MKVNLKKNYVICVRRDIAYSSVLCLWVNMAGLNCFTNETDLAGTQIDGLRKMHPTP